MSYFTVHLPTESTLSLSIIIAAPAQSCLAARPPRRMRAQKTTTHNPT